MGRCIKEIERIYGIRNGGNRGNQYKVANPNSSALATQEDLAKELHLLMCAKVEYKNRIC